MANLTQVPFLFREEAFDMTKEEAADRLNRLYKRLHEEWRRTERTPQSLQEHALDISALNLAIDVLLGKK